MADGYALATRRPSVVNLHATAGLGNGIGNLVNAKVNGSPLVVLVGQQDRRHRHRDPVLAGDLIAMGGGWAKWATEVNDVDELVPVIRRSFIEAHAAPAGPVLVALPMDMLEEPAPSFVPTKSQIRSASIPSPELIRELSSVLTSFDPDRIAIVAGDEVAASGAVLSLVNVAERLGCRVYGSPFHGQTVFPSDHPLWKGALPLNGAAVARSLTSYDCVLLVGGQAFLALQLTEVSPIRDGVMFIHIAPSESQLGRSWTTTLGLVGDPDATLRALLAALEKEAGGGGASQSLEAAEKESRERGDQMRASYAELRGRSPLAAALAIVAIVEHIPADAIVVDEAITASPYVRRMARSTGPGQYYSCRGGGLGWGMPAAVGVSFATNDAPIVCVVGDGSAMYSPQSLWTAARYERPVTFVVINNRRYGVLATSVPGLNLEDESNLALGSPALDFVRLAEGMGVAATKVSDATELAAVVADATRSGRTNLVEVEVAPE
jgi:benzoylformate decarboxylase